MVAIDGTGVATFNKHRDSCLYKTSKNDVTTYHQNVLEAKLLTPSGLSLSMATEWISNEGKEEYQKQDCEREAYKRLAKKLKKQITHIINQLIETSQTIKVLINKTLKCTVKYLWKRLLSFLLENQIVEYEMDALVLKPFQIRLT